MWAEFVVEIVAVRVVIIYLGSAGDLYPLRRGKTREIEQIHH